MIDFRKEVKRFYNGLLCMEGEYLSKGGGKNLPLAVGQVVCHRGKLLVGRHGWVGYVTNIVEGYFRTVEVTWFLNSGMNIIETVSTYDIEWFLERCKPLLSGETGSSLSVRNGRMVLVHAPLNDVIKTTNNEEETMTATTQTQGAHSDHCGFIIWNPQSPKNPVVTHSSHAVALKEASRLTEKNLVPFYVAQLVNVVTPVIVPKVEIRAL